jgi:hypothetical protein
MSNRIGPACLAFLVALGACSGAEKAPSQATPGKEQPSADAAAPTVNPTGRVIGVELYSDEKGNYFKPAEIHAKRGD